MKKLVLLMLMALYFKASGQEYASSKISSNLRKNADVVIRNEKTEIEVKSENKVIYNYKIILTILNKQGDYRNTVYATYDKNTSLTNLKVNVYDSLGIKLKEYGKNDFTDQSQISDFYEDDRIKYLKATHNKYPYTVEFSYTADMSTNFFLPSWYPQDNYYLSIENSTYKITYPKYLPVRFKKSALVNEKLESTDASETVSFYCKDVSAIPYEELSVGIENISPWARISSSKFAYSGTQGDFTTWKSFGQWVYNLSAGLDVLPPDVIATVHQLTDQVSDPKEKIKILYHYLQSKTRYISVQLGIGGFQPFPATKVAANNYGDCKALSNYMKALLKEAKIPSQLVMVKAGKNKNILADFSSLQANHMILCVPMVKDTVWLECTSQKMPFNYLGSFTENRNVVLISETGGKLVKTPVYLPKDNFQFRKASVKVEQNGDAICKINTSFGGEQFEDKEYQLYEEPKNQKDNIYKYIAIANPELVNFSYQQKDKDLPQLEENLELKAPKLMNGVGSNLFLTLNLMNKNQYVPEAYENRKTNFAIKYSYVDKDELVYELPENFKVSFVPKDQEISSEFGKYKIQTKVEANKITYTREQTMWKKEYSPEKYNDLINFYKAIYKADKQKAVIDVQ